ncbi:translocation/assembly module TamB [Lysobacter sp. TY2-98]|uniref:translocation/assembly module TamB domain-containing protein n=1 Tax=Lysobacter sp. TY2-98 TaxID=2290922 RepID=UPI000E208727|nr:translocation/assembly module TamB domain-containing protein [Lysobacter sp. TY2-98]AXK73145.1 translocation/assembly module TamB [Lysobacter sp. TY2-98]
MSPLPDAPPPGPREPTPEEREARIRELRAKRRSRLRTLGIRSAVGSGVLLVAIVAFAYWLLTTIAGRDLLLAQIKARLPADASLEWKSAEGPASGPMTLHDVRFHWKKLAFAAQRVTIDPALRPLLGRRLRLDAMQVERATLDLPPSDTPFELPRWPQSLPQITVPLALQADDIRIDGLRVTRQVAPVIDIRRVRGGLDASTGKLVASRVDIDSDRGRFAINGIYAPIDHYRTDLVATALVPVKNSRGPLRLGFVARGDLDAMNVAVAGAAPGAVRATLTLRGADRPRWQLNANAHGIDLAALTATATDAQVKADIDLEARGVGGDGTLQGAFVQGDRRVVVHPSTVHLEQQVLAFAPLDVELLGGRVTVRGRGDFGERHNARVDYTVSARGLRWGDGDAQVVTDADLAIAGTQAAWTVNGDSALLRRGHQAHLALAGTGRRGELTVQRLEARMPTGTLDANGRISARPLLDWNLHANLAGFDPGYFAPGWSGALHGTLATTGRRDDGGALHAIVDVPRLGGRLRGRRMGGSAHVTLEDGLYRGVVALNVDGGRLLAQGEAGFAPLARWNATAQLQRFDPAFLVTGWPGAVDATLRTSGRREAGAPGRIGVLDATFDVPRIGGTLRGRALAGHGTAHLRGGDVDGEVQLTAGSSRLDARGRIADRLDVDATLSPVQLADLLPDARGVVRGTLRVTGPRTAPDVTADLDGRDVAFADYRAATLTAKGRLPWHAGGAPGALVVHGNGLQLGLPLDALDADARGAVEALQLRATAHGDFGGAAVNGALRRTGAVWAANIATLQLTPTRGAAWQLTRAANVRFGDGRIAVDAACLRSSAGGELCGNADWPRRGADITARALPLTLVAGYLPARADGTPWPLRGNIDAQAQVRPAGGSWRGTAHVTSPEGGFRLDARHDYEVVRWRALDARVGFDPQRLQVEMNSGLFDHGRVQGRVAMGWAAYAPLSGDVSVDTDELTWMELFSPDIVDPRGRLTGRITLGGTRTAPLLGGQARLTGFTTEMPALGVNLTQGEATLAALPDGSARIDGHVRSGDGVLNIDGRLGWRDAGAPLQLNLRGTNVEVANTRELRAVVNPDVVVRSGSGQPITVTGTVVVPSALLMLERLDGPVKTSSDVVVLDPIDAKAEVQTPVALDLKLVAGDDVRLKGFGLDGTLAGSVQVHSAPGRNTTARGQMDVAGRYVAYGQKLDVTRGHLTWQGGEIGDPILDIRAERDVGGVTAGIDVSGRASRPRANVWSSEGDTQSEALSYLALGRPLPSLGGEQGQQITAASAALTAGGGLLASQLGARLGLDDAGVSESRALGGSVLGIGKYLSPRLYVGYGVSLFGAGQVLTLKYLIRRGVDFTVESSTVESRASLNYRKEK